MEIGYITNAIRRYWAAVLLCSLIAVAGGLLIEVRSDPLYSASSLVLIAPPGSGASSADDRYVASQLIVMESPSVAAAARSAVEASATTADAPSFATIAQVADTNVVRITVQSEVAVVARDVANAWAAAYLVAVREQVIAAEGPEIRALDAAVGNLEDELAVVDEQIGVLLDPFRPTGPISLDEALAIPTIEQIDPALATRRSVLIEQYTQLLRNRNEIELGTGTRIASRIVEEATLPTEAGAARQTPLLFVSLLIGPVLGALAAIALARSSRRVLDLAEAEELLGIHIAATFPRRREMPAVELPIVRPPADIAQVVNSLCVQAEALTTESGSITVAVVGTDRSAPTAPIAVAVAHRFAEIAPEVWLVDADTAQRRITNGIGHRLGGYERLLNMEPGQGRPTGQTRRTTGAVEPYVETNIPSLRVVGISEREIELVQRVDLDDLIAIASERTPVIVFDGGVLLDSATAIRLVQRVDVIIPVIPLRSQTKAGLSRSARQLRDADGLVMPLAIPRNVKSQRATRRRTARWTSRSTAHQGPETPADQVESRLRPRAGQPAASARIARDGRSTP